MSFNYDFLNSPYYLFIRSKKKHYYTIIVRNVTKNIFLLRRLINDYDCIRRVEESVEESDAVAGIYIYHLLYVHYRLVIAHPISSNSFLPTESVAKQILALPMLPE